MDFSIIIACKKDNPYLQGCLSHCLSLDASFELLVFPDTPFTHPSKKVKICPTGSIGPAEKRDLALKHAKERSFKVLPRFPLAIFLTHLTYGIGFVTGLITRELYT